MKTEPIFQEIDGFRCYAPELAIENEGFSSDSFTQLYDLEKNNFWFQSRNELLRNLFKKYLVTMEAEVCEIGCGNGFVLQGLSTLSNLRLTGSEIHVAGLKHARERLPEVEFFQADATNLPFFGKYDAIGAFDVLEHITEDLKAMSSIHGALKKDGLFFITVPQYQWMWSIEDDVAFHKRRYSREEIEKKLIATGFRILYLGSFVFALFPFMLLQRLFGRFSAIRNESKDASLGLTLPSIINKIFLSIMSIDNYLIKRGFSLPWGGSVVVVAQKR